MGKLISECFIVAALLCVNFHFVHERVLHKYMPGGDEGSWMSAAAELSRGNGFSTRVLEHTFLTPSTLPRPDDYRYPGLVTVLSIEFSAFGISYDTALWSTAAILFLFELLVYITVRSYFGRSVAIITLLISITSLNLLSWSIGVNTEGLFGLVVGCIILQSKKLQSGRTADWLYTGVLCGLLYLVRPNGILFFAGALWLCFIMRKSYRFSWRAPAFLAFAAVCVMLPWLIRSAIHYGNPFHLAGSAGLLRATDNEPLTLSVWQFLTAHGIVYPIKSVFFGFLSFFKVLDFHEHGLQWLPLAGVIAGTIGKKRFYNPFIAAAFFVSFCACCYASYNSWAGLRYFTGFLPFVYAYGIAAVLDLLSPVVSQVRPALRFAVPALVAGLCVVPVAYPHRYYERVYAAAPSVRFPVQSHLAVLKGLVTPGSSYCAARASQWNFMTTYPCVCVQDSYDTALASWVLDKYNPAALVIFPSEYTDPFVRSFIEAFQKNGCSFVPAGTGDPLTGDSLVYLRIVRPPVDR